MCSQITSRFSMINFSEEIWQGPVVLKRTLVHLYQTSMEELKKYSWQPICIGLGSHISFNFCFMKNLLLKTMFDMIKFPFWCWLIYNNRTYICQVMINSNVSKFNFLEVSWYYMVVVRYHKKQTKWLTTHNPNHPQSPGWDLSTFPWIESDCNIGNISGISGEGNGVVGRCMI